MKPRNKKYLCRAKKVLKSWGKDVDGKSLGKVYATRTPYSCWGCGNPRHRIHGKDRLTMQERKFELGSKEQLNNLDQ